MKLLVGNVFFEPHSMGGATIVAEHMAAELASAHGWEVTAVSGRLGPIPAPSVVRYRTLTGIDAFSVGLPAVLNYTQRYDNPLFTERFDRIVGHVAPDIVHLHSLQDIGAGCIDVLERRKIPFVVTAHDAWWFCERQFMVTSSGAPCDQRHVDPRVCLGCGGQLSQVEPRLRYLLGQLGKAARVLAPSRHVRDLLLENGIRGDRVLINRNGVRPPNTVSLERAASGTVFGFVGGPGPERGWDLIVRSFPLIDDGHASLLAIDAGKAFERPWSALLRQGAGGLPLHIGEPYAQDGIDAAFAAMDVLLMPSLARESFGLAAREALLRDVWVIATDAGGLAEDIVDGENGTILPYPARVEDLAAAMRNRLGKSKSTLPYKNRVATVADQAGELDGILRAVLNDAR